jgi:hypothetical protein
MGFKQAAVLAPVSFFLGENLLLLYVFVAYHRRSPLPRYVIAQLAGLLPSNVLWRVVGVLFICFNVDHRILWGSAGLTDEVVVDGFQFYATFYNAPPAIKVRATDAFFLEIALARVLMISITLSRNLGPPPWHDWHWPRRRFVQATQVG